MARLTNGERIRRKRIQIGWTQADLAKKINVSQMQISNFETGKIVMRRDERDRIFELLGIDEVQERPDDQESETGVADNGPSPFGVWLNKTRLEKRLSVPELSNRAGVSAPAIYNVEAGRITNPRRETIKRLENALGVEVPAETTNEGRAEATITGVGEFFEFDPHNRNDWPESAGIYVLYDISERPIYVGQGASIKRRIADHEEKFWFKAPIVATGAFIVIDDADLRKKIETILIRFLKKNAVINKQNVDR